MNDDGVFDAVVAASYDRDHPGGEVEATVALLAGLAGGGLVLELAIGTGRIALPLARTGLSVHGIDLSAAMLAKLREKDGGADIPVTVGDMAETRVAARFTLVYLVFNAITNLTTQRSQTECFRNAAAHLAPGGAFLVEVAVPPLQRLSPGHTRIPFALTDNHWGVDEFDTPTQRFTSHHMRLEPGTGWKRLSIQFRYVWPSELDLMAQIAGLSLADRWGGWKREPFTRFSDRHVSVWRKHV